MESHSATYSQPMAEVTTYDNANMNLDNHMDTASNTQSLSQVAYSETINPADLAIQQMRDLEPLRWRGGDNFWDGPHDGCCILCGGGMELFGCQTCRVSYHSQCMTPSLAKDDVPAFWFCPHCVNRQLHIPPPSPEEHLFAPLPTSLPFYPSPVSLDMQESTPNATISSAASEAPEVPLENQRTIPVPAFGAGNPGKSPPESSKSSKVRHRPQDADLSPPSHTSQTNSTPKPTRTNVPPRKKSKYSALSTEVDKALSIIYTELETAAGYGKSEGTLHDKITALEQKLRVQEGQNALTSKELVIIKKELAREREEKKGLREGGEQVRILRGENEKLRVSLGEKEKELNEWRDKLRVLIGS